MDLSAPKSETRRLSFALSVVAAGSKLSTAEGVSWFIG